MTLNFKPLLFSAVAATLLTNCGGTADVLSTPVENIDVIPLKVSELTDKEKKSWGHLDLVKDTIPGMSVDKAYSELLQGKTPKTVVVAVIDSGIDIDHEDLDGVIWKNTDEIAGNGKDDDNNGYIDDIYGWNFLGDGYDEQLEMTRIVAKGPNAAQYTKAKADLDEAYNNTLATKQRIDQLAQQIPVAQAALRKHLGKDNYTKKDVYGIKTEDQALQQAIGLQSFLYDRDLTLEKIQEAGTDYTNRLNTYYSPDFNGRKTGDNPDDINDKPGYGNNNVKHSVKSESHGTHVAGIIAAERNNGLGANGVANNVKIMSIRVVPNGDEYDKDVALGIRYAVDNGAQIINTSFGKAYSPNSEWVRDAIAYAAKKDVLIVNAAGNDGADLDKVDTFPNDAVGIGPEVSDTFISIGALAPKYGSEMVAGFSNYGKVNVDVFAPGAKIYSTFPENDYQTIGGTSMAAPAAAGVAALIRGYYPKLSAAQVKQILMDSGLPIPTKVVVGGDANNVKPFGDLTKSGKMVNAYNALIMAAKMSK